MSRKKSLEKQHKTGNNSVLTVISIFIYLFFVYEDSSIIYLVNAEGPYYDFAHEFYPVSLVRLPICIIGIIVFFFSFKNKKMDKLNKWILFSLIPLLIIQCII
jgi:hypothetical protein